MAKEHGSTILGTIQRLPILYWLDARFRMNGTDPSISIYAESLVLFSLLSLNSKALMKVYNAITCAIFMVAIYPVSKDKFWNDFLPMAKKYSILFSLKNEKMNTTFYLTATIYLFVFAISISTIVTLVKLLKSIHRRLFVTLVLVIINYLMLRIPILRELSVTGWTRHLFHTEQQILMAALTYDIFRLNIHVFYALNMCYTSLFMKDIPLYIYMIFAFVWIQFHRDEHPLIEAWDFIKGYIRRIALNSVINQIIHVLLPYAISICIGRLSYLYSRETKEPGHPFLNFITVICATLLGTASYIVLITYICFACIMLAMWVLRGRRLDDANIGYPMNPPVLFIILCMQSLNSSVVIHGSLMCVGIFLVIPPLLRDICKYTEHVFLWLGTSGGGTFQDVKGVLLYLFFTSLPVFVVVKFLQSDFSTSFGIFWSLVVVSTWLSVSVEALGTLAIYCLLVYDTRRSEPFEKLDDVMYYIRASIGVTEIVIEIFNVCFLMWNLTANQWSWTGILILAGCLYNTYDDVKNGWENFQRRRLTAKRLTFLPNATKEQLEAYNDVCAICLRNMSSAKVTPCNHFFHESCLKKWSYVRETCPLCNKLLNVDWFVQRMLQTFRGLANLQQEN